MINYKLLSSKEYKLLLAENNNLKAKLLDAKELVQNLIDDKLDFDFSSLNSNKNILTDTLENLTEKLKKIQKEQIQRKWIADGLSIFSEIQKKHADDLDGYVNKFNAALVKMLNVNHSCIYLASEKTNSNSLELAASHAFNRKKFDRKNVLIGDGLLGQCLLEKETLYIKNIPENYISISSGLGEASPNCLLIVPAKVLSEVFAVIEIARFDELQTYEIEFAEKIAETFAYTIKNIKSTENTLNLLKESQILTEDLKSTEEEMRQNLEELTATQDEMIRKQNEIDVKSSLLSLTIDTIPYPIFIKNNLGFYTLVNKAQSEFLGLKKDQIINKKDDDFVNDKTDLENIHKTDKEVIDTQKELELPLQYVTLHNGKKHILKTKKIPFVDSFSNETLILGISIDVTEKKSAEKRLQNDKNITVNNLAIDVAGRQRMLSQKIAFLAELVVKNKLEKIPNLKNALTLFEHSLTILKNGGVPNDMSSELEINKADDELLPFIQNVDAIWKEIKMAANEIINAKNENTNSSEIVENSIQFIENNVDSLLQLSDKLMKKYSQISKNNIVNFDN